MRLNNRKEVEGYRKEQPRGCAGLPREIGIHFIGVHEQRRKGGLKTSQI